VFWKLQENVLTDQDLENLTDFIKTTKRFTQFTNVAKFEAAYAQWQGCQYCVYVNSGSSATLIMIAAASEMYNWPADSEVIVPAVTWPTTITPVMQSKYKPVFVDANLSDLSFDYDKLAAAITDKTRAIFIAHLLGFPADIKKIQQIIGSRNIALLEDCCESQGATIDGKKVGNFSLAGSFSFYWGHHMTTVEGGMICTNDEEFYKLLLLKRSHGLARELPERFHAEIKKKYPAIDFNFLFLSDGFNVRNTELHAVLGLSQLPKMNGYIDIRNKNYRSYLDICKNYEDQLHVIKPLPGYSSFVLPFFFKDAKKKPLFQECMMKEGIESRPLISGNLLRQPFLNQYYDPENFKNADFIHENAFYIGNNQFVDDSRMERLAQLTKDFFSKN
jgi:CDP-6-deoxy-D-xylo-4-hexulose-3-dehydrase